ncbi:MAG TPA: LUD domain-containing protein [Candidatus Limnocylindria bacterium]|nr:LUD domain-containing protein [Candidatus Limnocylindria bacterium]
MIAPFGERYRRALADPRLKRNLLAFQRAWRLTRDAAFDRLQAEGPRLGASTSSFAEAKARLVAAKDSMLADPAAARARFVAAFAARGGIVHDAPTADDARDIVLRLLQERGATLFAKGKSMVGEEVFLNHHLEAAGIRVVETDLGEWIVQLAHETPSHMVMPAIHKSRQQVATLLEAETHSVVDPDDIGAMVRLARAELRRVFLTADAGMIGANALIADTGTVMLVTNEGNGDLVSTLPKTLIVIAGWEKLVPAFADAASQLRLLARSATAQEITTYTSFITGADDGREIHLVLVDNGRSALHADPAFRDVLRCIRCAACADVCPSYQVVGGHVFGYIYSGPIGLVNTAAHHGLDAAAGPQSLCVSCNACATICPVDIPLPQQILRVRASVVEANGLPLAKRLAFAVWSRPRVFDAVMRVASVLQRPLRRGAFLRVPLPPALRWRSVPALAVTPARDTLLGRTFEASANGPWTSSKARGLTVAYFLQCITDRFAPEQARAAIELLRACGARVVVPAGQHCCGLPPLDAGDRATARRMAKQTIHALEAVAADHYVSAGASCAIAIAHDYAELLADEPDWRARAERIASRTLDLLSFLERVADPAALPLRSDAATVTVHSFCQTTNVMGSGDAGQRLLERAGIPVRELAERGVCCGFGGSTSIDHPELAREIAERKLDNVRATGAAVLVTDNPGCLLHLRGAADVAHDRFVVRHVAEVLWEGVAR